MTHVLALMLAVACAWFLYRARSQRREDIEAAPHGPNLEAVDRRARFTAALLELQARIRKERETLRRKGLLS